MTIIAVDPGAVCGVFLFYDKSGTVQHFEAQAWNALEFLHKTISSTSETYDVVAERWVQQSMKQTPQYDALEVIGALRFITTKWNMRHLTLQSRSDKSRVTDLALREVGWYHASHEGHSLDAARHALVRLARTNPRHELVRRLAGMGLSSGKM